MLYSSLMFDAQWDARYSRLTITNTVCVCVCVYVRNPAFASLCNTFRSDTVVKAAAAVTDSNINTADFSAVFIFRTRAR